MGGLHPRNKWHLAFRLVRGALAIAYGRDDVSYAGAILDTCQVDYSSSSLTMTWNEPLLNGEKIIVKHPWGFEVQTASSLGGWFGVNVSSVDENTGDVTLDLQHVLGEEISKTAIIETTESILGLRYAWRDMPCCIQAINDWPNGNNNYTCYEEACAIYTSESSLPAIPFQYPVNSKGNCVTPF